MCGIVEFLHGAVSRHGKQLGIKTPANDTVTRVLMAIAADRRKEEVGKPQLWDRYRGKPDVLAAELP